MTVGTAERIVEYPGDNSAVPRAIPFMFLANDDLRVTRINANGSRTVLVRGTHYTVAGAANPAGGSVTPLAPIVDGTIWRIEGVMPLGQPIEYTPGDDFPAKSHERGLDRAMIAAQEQRRDLAETQARALMVPIGEDAPEVGSLEGANGKALGVVDGRVVPIANDVAGAEQIRADVAELKGDVQAIAVTTEIARAAAVAARDTATLARDDAEAAAEDAEAARDAAEIITQAASDALAAGTISDLVGTRIYTSQAALFADLVPADNLYALVVGDPDPVKNDLYQKNGATTAGNWDGPLGFFAAASSRAQQYSDMVVATTRAAIEQLGTISFAGNPTSPVPEGTNTADVSHYVWPTPQTRHGFVLSIELDAVGAGTLNVGVYSKTGDEFDRVRYVPVEVPGAGRHTIPLLLEKGEGELVGVEIVDPTVRFLITGGPDPSGGWYTGAALPFTDEATILIYPFSLRFEVIEIDYQGLTDSVGMIANSAIAAASAVVREAGTTSFAVYPTTPVPAGTGNADAVHYVWGTPQAEAGYIIGMEIYTGAAGTIRIGSYTRVGDTFDRARYQDVLIPAAGRHVIPCFVEKKAGELVGVEPLTAIMRFSNGVDLSGGWHAGETVPFISEDPTQIYPMSLRLEVVEMGGSSGAKSRPTSIDLPWGSFAFIGMGQSLMEGSRTDTNGEDPITTVQEYDTVCLPAYPDAPSELRPATAANSQRAARGEWSGLGAARQFRDALSRDHNISYQTTRSRVIIANNGLDGQRLNQINQGSPPYNSAIAQAGALTGLAGEASGVLAVLFAQGESDSAAYAATGYGPYKALFKEFAADIDADLRAATGQAKRVPTIAYQIGSIGREIALAHLDASLESPLIVVACPMYQFDYYDGLHIDAASERHMGGYFGEAAAQWAAGAKFEPLRPISAVPLGNTVLLTFNKSGLVFDTALVPAQARNGFSCTMADGVTANNPTATAVVNGNQVRLTFATPPDSGATIRYGAGAATGKGAYVGGAGNLRDSAGDARSIDGFPLHNWSVLFDWAL